MDQRPKCELCENPALVFMFNKFFCGNCVTEWDKIQKRNMLIQMKESMKK